VENRARKSFKPLSYSDAGVDIAAQDAAIESFKAAVERSHEAVEKSGAGRMLEGVGAFGAAFLPAIGGYADPVLVASTDGLGTKVLLHARFGTWELAGRDLVGTVLNDVLCSGARPLFLLDYIGWHGLAPAQLSAIVSGVASACADAGCALAGGELSEMRDVYKHGEFDLTGTGIGIVDRGRMLGASRVTEGSVILGLRSSGVHANGFTLVRKVVAGLPEEAWTAVSPEGSLAERLLRPTFCYASAMAALLGSPCGEGLQAAAHISGGGLVDNLPRVMPEGLGAVVDAQQVREAAGPIASLFDIIQTEAANAGLQISETEMHHVFNMGIGFALIAAPDLAFDVQAGLAAAGIPAGVIGTVCRSEVRFKWRQ
jgi:phosphoribosylformylglycinamidine cyclo-ligase